MFYVVGTEGRGFGIKATLIFEKVENFVFNLHKEPLLNSGIEKINNRNEGEIDSKVI